MYQIFNSWAGSACFSYVFSKSTLSVQMAKPFNPQKGGKVPKGTKVYDWEHSLFFSMTIDEAQKFMDYWQGENVKAQMKQPAFQENFHLYHDNGNSGNMLFFSKNGDKFYLAIGPKENTISMPLGKGELNVFLKMLNFMVSFMPAATDFLKELGKVHSGTSSFNPGNDLNGKPYQQSNGNGNDYNPNNGHGQYRSNNYNNYQRSNNYQRNNYQNNNGGSNYNNYQPQAPQAPQASFNPPRPPAPAPQPANTVQPSNEQPPFDVDDFTV